MTAKTILTASGTLVVRLLQLAMKLCVGVVSVLVQAAWAGAGQSDVDAESPQDKEMSDYYDRFARADYDERYMN